MVLPVIWLGKRFICSYFFNTYSKIIKRFIFFNRNIPFFKKSRLTISNNITIIWSFIPNTIKVNRTPSMVSFLHSCILQKKSICRPSSIYLIICWTNNLNRSIVWTIISTKLKKHLKLGMGFSFFSRTIRLYFLGIHTLWKFYCNF